MSHTLALGKWGEEYAARYITSLGGSILARNCRAGGVEADIVYLEGSVVVVCEVKTRRTLRTGFPQEAVDNTRLHRLQTFAHNFHHPRATGCSTRIDVVAITVTTRGVQLNHLLGVNQ